MDFDWKTWCRFCGSSQNNVKFESTIDIEFYFEISDQSPKICQQCSVFLKEFERFLHKTEQANVFFKELANLKNVDSSKINKIREIFGLDLLEINWKSSENYTTVLPDLKINVEASGSGSCTVTLPELNVKDELDVLDLPESIQKTVQDVNTESNQVKETDDLDMELQINALLTERKKKKPKKVKIVDPDKKKIMENRELVYKIIPTNCHLCEAKFTSMKMLIEHCNKEHNCSPQVPCVCGYMIDRYEAFTRHRKKCCKALLALYRCDICGNSYAYKNVIQRHIIKKHIVEGKIICKTCGREYKKNSELKFHEKTHLPDEEKEKFACTQCDKIFASKYYLNYHVSVVHENKPREQHTCHICAVSLTSKKSLEYHILSHVTTLNFECEICSRKFKSKILLKSHQAYHNKEKKHFCEICNRGFLRIQTKKNHMVSHSDERPFTCPEPNCDLTFKRKREIEVHHNRVHLGKQRYICKVCGADFYYTKERYEHIKEKHPKEFEVFEEKWKLLRKKK